MDNTWHPTTEIPDDGRNVIVKIDDKSFQLGKYTGGKYIFILGWEIKDEIKSWRYDD